MGPEGVRALRLAVLRPGGGEPDVRWPGDEDPRAGHFAIALDAEGTAVAVASVVPEPHPQTPREGDFRLRGMATAPGHRGRGLGAALVAACVEHAAAHGASRVWCNARVAAVPLYERAGFVAETPVFEEPGIGPHRRMSLLVR